MPALGFGDGAGVGGALGGEGAFHLGEQSEQPEGDAAHAFVGGVDRLRVSQVAHADAARAKIVYEVEDFNRFRPSRSRVCTTMVSPGRCSAAARIRLRGRRVAPVFMSVKIG